MLTQQLWESDAASALTNRAARALERTVTRLDDTERTAMIQLIESLWRSDTVSMLTNQAARALEEKFNLSDCIFAMA